MRTTINGGKSEVVMEQLQLNFEAAERPVETAPVKAEEPPKSQRAQPQAQPQPQIITVSDINKAVRGSLESQFSLIWVKGEISNFKPHSSGHFYFSLKDSKAQISAVMFRGFNQGLRFKPQDGLEVIVRGKITVYEPRGTYQIFCELMEPVGAGALQLAFEQLKKKLELEGLFDPKKKRALPLLPKHVAVVTSPTGAAIRDVLNILARRFRGLKVTVVPALVQGPGAPASICAALELAQKIKDVDVMIVGRGGGSMEDLWAFNDEKVARTIAACRVPIISGVGHEIDFTIADFVADLRAPTPSAAAELVSRNAAEMVERIQIMQKRLRQALAHRFEMHRQKVNGASRRLVDPKRRLQDLALRCDELSQRLEASIKRHFESLSQKVQMQLTSMPKPTEKILRLLQQIGNWQTKLEAQIQRRLESKKAEWAKFTSLLDAVSPLKVVERGFTISRKDGHVIKSVDQLKIGDQVELSFAKGKAQARIENLELEKGEGHGL